MSGLSASYLLVMALAIAVVLVRLGSWVDWLLAAILPLLPISLARYLLARNSRFALSILWVGLWGATLAALLAVHRTFPLMTFSFFYRSAYADAENLFSPGPLILDEASYAQVRRDFNSLRDAVAKNLPRGKNVQGVITMRQEVSDAISQPVSPRAAVQPVPPDAG